MSPAAAPGTRCSDREGRRRSSLRARCLPAVTAAQLRACWRRGSEPASGVCRGGICWGCRQAGSGCVSWVTEICRPARQPGGSWPAAAPNRPGPVVRPAGQQSPVTGRTPCRSTPSPAVPAPTARPPITWAGPPACGSPSPPAAGRRRAPEPWPFAGQVSDPAGQAGTAARRSAGTATRSCVMVFGLAAALECLARHMQPPD